MDNGGTHWRPLIAWTERASSVRVGHDIDLIADLCDGYLCECH